jgi:hypothetical protein
MRLEAARMTEPDVAGTLQWPIHQDTKVCLLFRFKDPKLLHPENFFPSFPSCGVNASRRRTTSRATRMRRVYGPPRDKKCQNIIKPGSETGSYFINTQTSQHRCDPVTLLTVRKVRTIRWAETPADRQV